MFGKFANNKIICFRLIIISSFFYMAFVTTASADSFNYSHNSAQLLGNNRVLFRFDIKNSQGANNYEERRTFTANCLFYWTNSGVSSGSVKLYRSDSSGNEITELATGNYKSNFQRWEFAGSFINDLTTALLADTPNKYYVIKPTTVISNAGTGVLHLDYSPKSTAFFNGVNSIYNERDELAFRIVLSSPVYDPITVIANISGTSSRQADYTDFNESSAINVTVPAGETVSDWYTYTVKYDGIPEVAESFNLISTGNNSTSSLEGPIMINEAGDADQDGYFTTADLIQIFTFGRYEQGPPANWAEGDFNGDNKFDSTDFVEAFTTEWYEGGNSALAVDIEALN